MTPAQRAEFLEQSKAHFDADMLIKGTYAADDESFKGCSVGCHLFHIIPDATPKKVEYAANKHRTVAAYYGYPEWLALLQDTIFEGLPNGQSAKWHVLLAETLAKLPDGYDWQLALHRVHVALLRVVYQSAGTTQEVVQSVIDLHVRAGLGERVSAQEWSAARSAAWSAAESAASAASAARSAAESAAESAARSAAWSAAWSAAESAASAARSAAESAARSAAESAAWSAAESAAFVEMRDGILKALTGEA